MFAQLKTPAAGTPGTPAPATPTTTPASPATPTRRNLPRGSIINILV